MVFSVVVVRLCGAGEVPAVSLFFFLPLTKGSRKKKEREGFAALMA